MPDTPKRVKLGKLQDRVKATPETVSPGAQTPLVPFVRTERPPVLNLTGLSSGLSKLVGGFQAVEDREAEEQAREHVDKLFSKNIGPDAVDKGLLDLMDNVGGKTLYINMAARGILRNVTSEIMDDLAAFRSEVSAGTRLIDDPDGDVDAIIAGRLGPAAQSLGTTPLAKEILRTFEQSDPFGNLRRQAVGDAKVAQKEYVLDGARASITEDTISAVTGGVITDDIVKELQGRIVAVSLVAGRVDGPLAAVDAFIAAGTLLIDDAKDPTETLERIEDLAERIELPVPPQFANKGGNRKTMSIETHPVTSARLVAGLNKLRDAANDPRNSPVARFKEDSLHNQQRGLQELSSGLDIMDKGFNPNKPDKNGNFTTRLLASEKNAAWKQYALTIAANLSPEETDRGGDLRAAFVEHALSVYKNALQVRHQTNELQEKLALGGFQETLNKLSPKEMQARLGELRAAFPGTPAQFNAAIAGRVGSWNDSQRPGAARQSLGDAVKTQVEGSLVAVTGPTFINEAKGLINKLERERAAAAQEIRSRDDLSDAEKILQVQLLFQPGGALHKKQMKEATDFRVKADATAKLLEEYKVKIRTGGWNKPDEDILKARGVDPTDLAALEEKSAEIKNPATTNTALVQSVSAHVSKLMTTFGADPDDTTFNFSGVLNTKSDAFGDTKAGDLIGFRTAHDTTIRILGEARVRFHQEVALDPSLDIEEKKARVYEKMKALAFSIIGEKSAHIFGPSGTMVPLSEEERKHTQRIINEAQRAITPTKSANEASNEAREHRKTAGDLGRARALVLARDPNGVVEPYELPGLSHSASALSVPGGYSEWGKGRRDPVAAYMASEPTRKRFERPGKVFHAPGVPALPNFAPADNDTDFILYGSYGPRDRSFFWHLGLSGRRTPSAPDIMGTIYEGGPHADQARSDLMAYASHVIQNGTAVQKKALKGAYYGLGIPIRTLMEDGWIGPMGAQGPSEGPTGFYSEDFMAQLEENAAKTRLDLARKYGKNSARYKRDVAHLDRSLNTARAMDIHRTMKARDLKLTYKDMLMIPLFGDEVERVEQWSKSPERRQEVLNMFRDMGIKGISDSVLKAFFQAQKDLSTLVLSSKSN